MAWEAGCGPEALVPLHVGLFRELLECPHDTVAGLLQNKLPKRARYALNDLVSEITTVTTTCLIDLPGQLVH